MFLSFFLFFIAWEWCGKQKYQAGEIIKMKALRERKYSQGCKFLWVFWRKWGNYTIRYFILRMSFPTVSYWMFKWMRFHKMLVQTTWDEEQISRLSLTATPNYCLQAFHCSVQFWLAFIFLLLLVWQWVAKETHSRYTINTSSQHLVIGYETLWCQGLWCCWERKKAFLDTIQFANKTLRVS